MLRELPTESGLGGGGGAWLKGGGGAVGNLNGKQNRQGRSGLMLRTRRAVTTYLGE